MDIGNLITDWIEEVQPLADITEAYNKTAEASFAAAARREPPSPPREFPFIRRRPQTVFQVNPKTCELESMEATEKKEQACDENNGSNIEAQANTAFVTKIPEFRNASLEHTRGIFTSGYTIGHGQGYEAGYKAAQEDTKNFSSQTVITVGMTSDLIHGANGVPAGAPVGIAQTPVGQASSSQTLFAAAPIPNVSMAEAPVRPLHFGNTSFAATQGPVVKESLPSPMLIDIPELPAPVATHLEFAGVPVQIVEATGTTGVVETAQTTVDVNMTNGVNYTNGNNSTTSPAELEATEIPGTLYGIPPTSAVIPVIPVIPSTRKPPRPAYPPFTYLSLTTRTNENIPPFRGDPDNDPNITYDPMSVLVGPISDVAYEDWRAEPKYWFEEKMKYISSLMNVEFHTSLDGKRYAKLYVWELGGWRKAIELFQAYPCGGLRMWSWRFREKLVAPER